MLLIDTLLMVKLVDSISNDSQVQNSHCLLLSAAPLVDNESEEEGKFCPLWNVTKT